MSRRHRRHHRRPARRSIAASAALALAAALASASVVLLPARPAAAVELALLSKENWARLAPKGKEADAIFGDLVMQSDRATLVVAFPGQRRAASFTAPNAGGAIIDFEVRDAPSD